MPLLHWESSYAPVQGICPYSKVVEGQHLDSTAVSAPASQFRPLLVIQVASAAHDVNVQVPGLGVAASNRGLRSSVGRGVAVVGERGFRDDCGL